MRYVLGGIVCFLLVVFGIGWAIQGNDFIAFRFWAPKYEAARRETFEQSKAYTQGSIQELQNMEFEYAKANSDQKAALASVILHRAADFDEARLPADLRGFISGLRTAAVSP